MPLHSAGKLGYVLFQFPEWFVPGDENRAYILHVGSGCRTSASRSSSVGALG